MTFCGYYGLLDEVLKSSLVTIGGMLMFVPGLYLSDQTHKRFAELERIIGDLAMGSQADWNDPALGAKDEAAVGVTAIQPLGKTVQAAAGSGFHSWGADSLRRSCVH